MNNEVKAKKHMLCEKAPFLAMILQSSRHFVFKLRKG